MMVIGLTGGIATGKSTVTEILKEFNTLIIDADIIARQIVEVGKPALNEIVHVFGKEILTDEGQLDRKKLGKLVFNDEKNLEKLNRITHPKILNEIQRKIATLRKTTAYPIVIIDAALLIEMNMTGLVDEVWLVVANQEQQIRRIIHRDHLTEEEALKRIQSQMDTKVKMQYADVIIENNEDLDVLRDKVEHEINRVFNR